MQFITSNITNFGLILVAIWLVIKEFRSGNDGLAKKIREDDEKRITQLEGILKNERETSEQFKSDMEKIISGYRLEISKLEATNNTKDGHIKDLKDLLLDKNPEVIKVLGEIRDFLKTSSEKTDKVLGYQTKILEDWQDRSKRIDEASKEHKGDIIRVPSE